MTLKSLILESFVRRWKTEDRYKEILRRSVDVIVPISFVTKKTELTTGTYYNLETALIFIKRRPLIRIAFSSCSYPFEGASDVENKLKLWNCQEEDREPVIAAPMINSVDEAMNIRTKLETEGIKHGTILVITGELHSRSARLIWEGVFKRSKILIACIPYGMEVQPDHPVPAQRNIWKWALSNILRQIALNILPLEWVRKIKHPIHR